MAIQVIGNPATVVAMYEALYGAAPSNPLFQNYLGYIVANGESAFAKLLAANFDHVSDEDFTVQVLTNLGITAETIPPASYAALLAAGIVAFGAYPLEDRGQIVLNFTKILASLEGDATFGAAALAHNQQMFADFTYASNPANTVPGTPEAGEATNNQNFSLTTDVDEIPGLIGSKGSTNNNGDNKIVGNSSTYTPGDILNGGTGDDTLDLVLNESPTAYTGVSVFSVEHLWVRGISSSADGADQVLISMTGFDDQLEHATISQSSGHVRLEDIQNNMMFSIDDVRGDVELDFDNQNVPESVTVDVNEFGYSAGLDDGEDPPDLMIEDVAIVNINDAAAGSEFDNNFRVTGEFSELNVNGGESGTDLTMGVMSSAHFLTAHFEDNESDAKDISIDLSGADEDDDAGEDTDTDEDSDAGGDLMLTTGDHDDVVSVWGGNLTYVSSIDVGGGDDDLSLEAAYGSVFAGLGNDMVYVDGHVGDYPDEEDGPDGGVGAVDLGAGDDELTVEYDIYEKVIAGDGDDSLWIGGHLAGRGMDLDAGELLGGDVGLGNGNDMIEFTLLNLYGVELVDEAAVLAGGDGTDTMVVQSFIDFFDGPFINQSYLYGQDFFEIDGAQDLDGNAGDDEVEATTGVDRITDIENLVINAVSGEDYDGEDGPFGAAYELPGEDVDGAVDLSAFDDSLTDISVNVLDSNSQSVLTLTEPIDTVADYNFYNWVEETITVSSEESDPDADDEDPTYTGSAVESLDGDGDDFWEFVDVQIGVEQEADGSDDTLAVVLAGQEGFDVAIHNIAALEYDDVGEEFVLSEAVNPIENIDISVTDAFSHSISLNGGDVDGDVGEVPDGDLFGFTGTVTLTGGAAGSSLNLINVLAGTVAAGTTEANVYIDLDGYSGEDSDDDRDLTITTSTGDDVVNANFIDPNDGEDETSGDLITADDTIDLGTIPVDPDADPEAEPETDTDRLIVSQSMGDVGEEDDSVYENKAGIEEVQFNGDGEGEEEAYDAMLNGGAYEAGVQHLIQSNDVDLDVLMEVDYERDLTVDLLGSNSLYLDNQTADGNAQYDLTLNADATEEDVDINMYLNTGVRNTVLLNVMVDHDDLVVASYDAESGDDEIDLQVEDGDGVDNITFLDNSPDEEDEPSGEDNGDIFVVLDTGWNSAGGVLKIDASDIANDDADPDGEDNTDTGGLNVDAGLDDEILGPEDIFLFDGLDTVDGEDDWGIDVAGSANDDWVEGTVADDVVNSGAGDDFIASGDGDDDITTGDGDDEVYAGEDSDTVDTGAGDDFVGGGLGDDDIDAGDGDDEIFGDGEDAQFDADFGGGDDVIDAGAGDDTIFGSAGNDTITGGADSDLIVFSYVDADQGSLFGVNQNAVNNGRDAITDFTAGDDGDKLAFGNFDDTLIFSSLSWKNVVDGETDEITLFDSVDLANNRITLNGELALISTIDLDADENATVAGWIQNGSSGGVVITGDAGSDELIVWYVDDAADGIGGSITADDIALVGVITMTGGSIASLNLTNFLQGLEPPPL